MSSPSVLKDGLDVAAEFLGDPPTGLVNLFENRVVI
jgi:hypothetical protein